MNSRKNLSEKLAEMQATEGRTYWQSLEELADTKAFAELMRAEFPVLADIWPDNLNRRKFLALMGASLALGGLGGCSAKPAPQQKIMPYVKPPEQLAPGFPLFFATTMVHAGEAVGLLVESHEGRPTKIEGNPDHPASLGATNVFHQASILTLYDPARSQTVIRDSRIHGWDDADNAMAKIMAQQREKGGAGVRLLTETIVSPTLAHQIEALLEQYPQAKWHHYEPINEASILAGANRAFGQPLVPVYDFSKADVIVSLDSDFLYTGSGHLKYARDFSARRRVRTSIDDARQATMNRLYVAETHVSCTGAKADHRLAVSMWQIEHLARQVAANLGMEVESGEGMHSEWIAAVARDLEAHRGRCLVLAGYRQPAAVHLLVNALNAHLGNLGETVRFITPPAARPVDPVQSLRELTADMRTGKVEALFILGGNPALTAPADLDFTQHLKNVPHTFHLSLYEDETSRLCGWHLPEAHYLEAWSDARSYDGTASIVQPLIEPLYQGRSFHEVVAVLAGQRDSDGRQIVQDYWRSWWQQQDNQGDFDIFWETALHDGVIADTAFPLEQVELSSDWQSHLPQPSRQDSDSLEIVFDADPSIFDGRYANNGWLQELPKPLTKLTWGNAAIMSPATAEKLGLSYGAYAHGGERGGYEVPVIVLQLGSQKVHAPIWIMPGHADNSMTLWLGHGRTASARVDGTWQQTLGFDAYSLRTTDAMWFRSGATAAKLSQLYPLACTQAHHWMEGRDIVRTGDLTTYHESPTSVVERNHPHHASGEHKQPPTMYKPFENSSPHKWGMVVDTTTCIGCNACVIACQAENNIPVVGKEQVLFGREMHWLRVDRYVSGTAEEPTDFHFQPVPCMHCENAPCEYVCPVEATVHSADGLNDMIYNRCVGTRFCSNNCPYKVRRFNFLEYADFKTETLRMQYNPDVTVRSRGVMEKCTYCVQRIRQAEITAEAAHRPLRDGEILTACQAVCPAEAIVFGDLNDPKSKVKQWSESPLNYRLLEELNTHPRTTYLGALKNPNPELEQA